MSEKAKAFVSAVVNVGVGDVQVTTFVDNLLDELRSLFEDFEVVLVDNCSGLFGDIENDLIGCMDASDSLTIVYMSEPQGVDACMEAGVDVAIGDFVYEFETLDYEFGSGLIWETFQKISKGDDVVVARMKGNSASRSLFYRLFNAYTPFYGDVYASLFQVESRRAINRVAQVIGHDLWRHVSFASCGLNNGFVFCPSRARKSKSRDVYFALDCLLLYTDLPRKYCVVVGAVSVILAMAMVILAILRVTAPISLWRHLIFACLGIITALGTLTIAMSLYQSNLRTRASAKRSYLIKDTKCLKKL